MKEYAVVFGATSFIGMNLVKKLIELDYEVLAVYRPDSANFERLYSEVKDNTKYLQVDICNEKTYSVLKQIERCDYLFLVSWAGSNKKDLQDNINQKSAVGLLKCLQQILNRIPCKKVIMFGTQAEYGLLKGTVSEKSECKPVSIYGREKLNFYNQASQYCKEKRIPFLEYRIHSIYGPLRGGMIGNLVAELNNANKKIIMQSNCEQKWDFVYIDDLIRALILGIKMNLETGCYNISSGKISSLKEYIELAKQEINPEANLVYGRQKDKTAPDFIFDSSKFRLATKWVPEVTFRQGIRKMQEACLKR